MAQTPEESPYIDLPELSEVFADRIRSVHWDGHCFRIEFAVGRRLVKKEGKPPSGAPDLHDGIYPCARIVLTPFATVNLKDALLQILAALEKQGVLKHAAPASEVEQ
jgi:hypothetical protein